MKDLDAPDPPHDPWQPIDPGPAPAYAEAAVLTAVVLSLLAALVCGYAYAHPF